MEARVQDSVEAGLEGVSWVVAQRYNIVVQRRQCQRDDVPRFTVTRAGLLGARAASWRGSQTMNAFAAPHDLVSTSEGGSVSTWELASNAKRNFGTGIASLPFSHANSSYLETLLFLELLK